MPKPCPPLSRTSDSSQTRTDLLTYRKAPCLMVVYWWPKHPKYHHGCNEFYYSLPHHFSLCTRRATPNRRRPLIARLELTLPRCYSQVPNQLNLNQHIYYNIFRKVCQVLLTNFSKCLVGIGGLEPPTFRLSGEYSNHLNYMPIRSQPFIHRPGQCQFVQKPSFYQEVKSSVLRILLLTVCNLLCVQHKCSILILSKTWNAGCWWRT